MSPVCRVAVPCLVVLACAGVGSAADPCHVLDAALVECDALERRLAMALAEATRMERAMPWACERMPHLPAARRDAEAIWAGMAQDLRAARDEAHARLGRVLDLRGRLAAAAEQPVVVADFSVRLRAEIDLRARTLAARAEFPAGLSYSTDQLHALLRGRPSLPEVDPLKLAGFALGLRTGMETDYDAVRAAVARDAGPRTVAYFSSPGFVEAFAPEALAEHVVKGALTGGATADASLAELRAVLGRELRAVQAFLVDHLGRQAGLDLLARVVESLLTQRPLELPGFAFRVLAVRATYEVGTAGHSALAPDFADRPPAPLVRAVVPRVGFALLVTLPEGRPGPTLRDLPALLDRPAEAFVMAGLPWLDLEELLVPDVARAVRATDLARRPRVWADRPVLDLRTTPVARLLGDRLEALAWGNQGLAVLERLTLDPHTGQIELAATVRVRHVASLADAARLVERTLEPVLDRVVAARRSLGEALSRLRPVAEDWPHLGQRSRLLGGLLLLAGRADDRR